MYCERMWVWVKVWMYCDKTFKEMIRMIYYCVRLLVRCTNCSECKFIPCAFTIIINYNFLWHHHDLKVSTFGFCSQVSMCGVLFHNLWFIRFHHNKQFKVQNMERKLNTTYRLFCIYFLDAIYKVISIIYS